LARVVFQEYQGGGRGGQGVIDYEYWISTVGFELVWNGWDSLQVGFLEWDWGWKRS